MIVEISGDIKCDGNDASRVTDFGAKLGTALDILAKGDPNARIFLVSAWGSFPSYVAYLKGLSTSVRLKHAGKSQCQMVAAPSGQVVPSHVAYLEKIVNAYDAQLAAVCSRLAHCHYDGGVAERMSVNADDITVDQNHLTVQGQAKLAVTEWAMITKFVNGF